MKTDNCIFCHVDTINFILENDLADTFWDRHPVSPGHLLIIPKRHSRNYFELTNPEIVAIHNLIHKSKILLDNDFQPNGYNIGINIDIVAKQIVMHPHVHVIPRYLGDDNHPIRKMFPGGGNFEIPGGN